MLKKLNEQWPEINILKNFKSEKRNREESFLDAIFLSICAVIFIIGVKILTILFKNPIILGKNIQDNFVKFKPLFITSIILNSLVTSILTICAGRKFYQCYNSYQIITSYRKFKSIRLSGLPVINTDPDIFKYKTLDLSSIINAEPQMLELKISNNCCIISQTVFSDQVIRPLYEEINKSCEETTRYGTYNCAYSTKPLTRMSAELQMLNKSKPDTARFEHLIKP